MTTTTRPQVVRESTTKYPTHRATQSGGKLEVYDSCVTGIGGRDCECPLSCLPDDRGSKEKSDKVYVDRVGAVPFRSVNGSPVRRLGRAWSTARTRGDEDKGPVSRKGGKTWIHYLGMGEERCTEVEATPEGLPSHLSGDVGVLDGSYVIQDVCRRPFTSSVAHTHTRPLRSYPATPPS